MSTDDIEGKTTRITRKGQVTIPKELRDEFGLEEGDEIRWEGDEDGIKVRAESDPISWPWHAHRRGHFGRETRGDGWGDRSRHPGATTDRVAAVTRYRKPLSPTPLVQSELYQNSNIV